MKTVELLHLVWPGVAAGVAAAALCGVLSVLVAARKMAFTTQGVSHAAMAGAGVAALLGVSGATATGIVGGTCVLAALVIGLLTARGRTPPDTAVAVVLVGAMAAGALMIAWRVDHPIDGAPRPPSWESLLFGSILTVRAADAALAAIIAIVGLAALWVCRRPILMTTFDPQAARAAGVSDARAAVLLALLVGAAVVITVKLVGVVLATALLVLPGAGALRCHRGLRSAVAVSALAAQGGILAGLVIAFEADAPPGAAAAMTLTLWWFVSGVRLHRDANSHAKGTRA